MDSIKMINELRDNREKQRQLRFDLIRITLERIMLQTELNGIKFVRCGNMPQLLKYYKEKSRLEADLEGVFREIAMLML